jgi:hypothetical protein
MEYGVPMSFNGKSGYFLEDDEYAKLVDLADQDNASEYTSELEIEVHNLRNVVDSVRVQSYDMYRELNDA